MHEKKQSKIKSSTTGTLTLNKIHFVSHQLKTPLATLKINIDLLKQTASKEQKEFVSIMEQELDRIAGFLSDTLDSEKRTARGGGLCLQWCQWNKLIQNVQNQLKYMFKHKKIKLHVPRAAEEIELYMDKVYMEQVMMNLLKNAVEHSPQNSTIDVNWQLTRKGELNVEVEDRGEGLQQKDFKQLNIFLNNCLPAYKKENLNHSSPNLDGAELFQNPVLNTWASGNTPLLHFLKSKNGVGLMFAHKIILFHGGTLSAQNRKGGGTSFVLNLPKARPGGGSPPT